MPRGWTRLGEASCGGEAWPRSRVLGVTLVVVIALGGCGDNGATDRGASSAIGGAGAGGNDLAAGSGGLSGRAGPRPMRARAAAAGRPQAAWARRLSVGEARRRPVQAGAARARAVATRPRAQARPAAVAGMPPDATGPKDGDPSKPVVAIDGIPCGPSMAGLGRRELRSRRSQAHRRLPVQQARRRARHDDSEPARHAHHATRLTATSTPTSRPISSSTRTT